ncbi:oligosaccharide flippase family protein [Desulfogranum japonicum]|uniref:oligosaccharide flippase family protein n=1 Tax=Desulfogranum japonicum TaxID=231447 RepID=UPI0003F6CB95|nr:polysaccharide biosynthesis C-terminal domain-containing protein [Desulfogranum japonicum]
MKFNAPVRVITRQFGQTLLIRILMTLVRVARNALLARILGPADRGFFSLICSLPEIIMTAGNCGLANASAYKVANQEQENPKLFANINFALLLLGGILFFISLAWVHQDWLVKDNVDRILAYKWHIAFATTLFLAKNVNLSILSALNRVRSVNVFALLESSVPLVLFVMLWWGFRLDALLAAVYSWLVTVVLITVLTTVRIGHGFRVSFQLDLQKQLLGYGGRGYFDTLFMKLLLRIDYIFVSALISSEALGYYAMATAAAELLMIVPNSLSVPLFSFLWKSGGKSKDASVATVLRILFAGMMLLAILYGFCGKYFILFVFGKEFAPAYHPFIWLLPGMVFFSFVNPIRFTLLGNNRPGTVSLVSGGCVLLNIFCNVVLIPYWGIVGVAMASSLSYIIGTVVLAVLYLRSTELHYYDLFFLRKEDLQLIVAVILNKNEKM